MTVPTDISGLQLWLDGTRGIYSDAGVTLATDGQAVQQWSDQSGNAKNATQLTSALRPIYRASVKGNPALQWTSTNNTVLVCGLNSDFASQAFTAFAVFQHTGAASVSSSTSVGGIGYASVVNKSDHVSANTVWGLFSNAVADGTTYPFRAMFQTVLSGPVFKSSHYGATLRPELISIVRSTNYSTNNKFIYRNGGLVFADNDGANMQAGASALGIGNDVGTGAQALNGYIREIIYYNSTLATSDRNAIEGYLRSKWSYASTANYTVNAVTCGNFVPLGTVNTIMNAQESVDGGITWDTVPYTNPVFTFPSNGGMGTTNDTQNLGLYKHTDGLYYVTYEINDYDNSNSFTNAQQYAVGIARAASLNGPWSWWADVQIFTPTPTRANVWNPTWFVDKNTHQIYIKVVAQNGGTFNTSFQLYMCQALDQTLKSWGPPVQLTGSGITSNIGDSAIIGKDSSPDGNYNIWFEDKTTLGSTNPTVFPALISSTSLTSGWTTTYPSSSNIPGFPSQAENFRMFLLDGIWRFYATPILTSPFFYAESDNNFATWTPLGPTTSSGFFGDLASISDISVLASPPAGTPDDPLHTVLANQTPGKHFTKKQKEALLQEIYFEGILAKEALGRFDGMSELERAQAELADAQAAHDEANDDLNTAGYSRERFGALEVAGANLSEAKGKLSDLRKAEAKRRSIDDAREKIKKQVADAIARQRGR